MENENTKTPNGDSRKYLLTPEEAKELLEKTDQCSVIVTGPRDIAPEGFETSRKDFMSARIVGARNINEGKLPENKGDTFVPVTAAEMNRNGVVVVLDGKVGRAQTATEVPENETQEAARKQKELEGRSERKYNQNQSNSQEK